MNCNPYWLLLPRQRRMPRPHLPPRPPPLDPDDARLIESIRNRGTTLNAGAWPWPETGTVRSGGLHFACSMRTAEARSRHANRTASTWFNDDMLPWWHQRWAELDARRQLISGAAWATWQRAAMAAREMNPEERAVMDDEWTAWERQHAFIERERAQRAERWSAEERAWFEEEAAAKAERLKLARQARETAAAQQRAANRATAIAHRELFNLASFIRRTENHVRRHPQYRRYPRKNAQTLEAAG